MIENWEQGVFWPQNEEYSNTSELVQMIAAAHGKKVRLLKGFSWILRLIGRRVGVVNKAFGNLCYDKSISNYVQNYNLKSLESSIIETEEATGG
jgi:UDP-glucose 4-epimerase